MRTIIAVAALSLAAACGQTTTVEEETPDTTAMEPATPPAPVMLTEADARARAEAAGYTNITALTQNADGTWSATGTMNGAATQITVSDSGVMVATAPATP